MQVGVSQGPSVQVGVSQGPSVQVEVRCPSVQVGVIGSQCAGGSNGVPVCRWE